MTRGRLAASLVGPVLALASAGCSSWSTAHPRASPSPVTSPIPAPAGLVTPGTLTVASDLNYPPQEYLDRSANPAGFDVDLAREIARQMALQLKVINTDVVDIVPGLAQQQRRYDLGISAQPETASLTSSAKTLRYFVAGLALLVPGNDPHHITGLDTVCGLRVGAEKGSSAETAIADENERDCQVRPIQYRAFSRDVDAVSAVKSGSLDAMVDDYPVAVYLQRQLGGLKVVPHQFSTSVDVMVFSISDDSVLPAVAAAFARLQRDGTYHRLLHQWGLDEGELR